MVAATAAIVIAANANSGQAHPMTPGEAMGLLVCIALCVLIGGLCVWLRDEWTDRFTAFALGFLGCATVLGLIAVLTVLVGTAAGY